MSSSTQGVTSVIKSIQYGTINLAGLASASATITSVNTAKAVLSFVGYRTGATGGQDPAVYFATLTLATPTSVVADRVGAIATGLIVAFCVTEYN